MIPFVWQVFAMFIGMGMAAGMIFYIGFRVGRDIK
jgi:hypothetical protein